MQISSVAPQMPIQPLGTVATTARVGTSSFAPAPARSLIFEMLASPSAPSSIEGAIDGAGRLTTAPADPIVDFPGIAKGDVFDIVKGSKVGFLGVKGEATILRFDPNHATFQVKAGTFGVKVDVTVDIMQTGPGTVRISSKGSGFPNTTANGRVVTQRTNYAEFERIDNPSERTILQRDARGMLILDTVVPTFGDAHIILKPR